MDEVILNRFMTEIILLNSLDHPNIVEFIDFFEDKKRYYIITELCHGGELFHTIEKYLKNNKFFDELSAA